MHGAVVAQVFGCAGAVLSIGLIVPQVWTSCVGRRVAGLSPAARWLMAGQSATWLTYGVAERVPLQVLTNAACLALHVSVLAALLLLDPAARDRRVVLPQVALNAAWLGIVVACALSTAVPVVTLAAGIGVVSVVPQLWRLATSPDEDSSGVSVPTTALSLLAGLCWVAHGVALALPAVVLPAAAGAAAAAWTLVLLRPGTTRPASAHHRQPVPVVLPLQRLVAA